MANSAAEELRSGKGADLAQTMKLLRNQCLLVLKVYDSDRRVLSVQEKEERKQIREEMIDWCNTANLALEICNRKGEARALQIFLDIANGKYDRPISLYKTNVYMKENFMTIVACMEKNEYKSLALPEELCILGEQAPSR